MNLLRFAAAASLFAIVGLSSSSAHASGGEGKAMGDMLSAPLLLFTGDPEIDARASTLVAPSAALYGGAVHFMWPVSEPLDLGWGLAFDQGKTDGVVRPELVARFRFFQDRLVSPYLASGVGFAGGVLRSDRPNRTVLAGNASLFAETGVAVALDRGPLPPRARVGVRGEILDPEGARAGLATVQLGVSLPVHNRRALVERLFSH